MEHNSDPAGRAFQERESRWGGVSKSYRTEFTEEGASHAWNRTDRHLDFGVVRGPAEVVTQPRLGLCPDGRRRSYSSRGCCSNAYRPSVDLSLAQLRRL